jgi:hypothetical protein
MAFNPKVSSISEFLPKDISKKSLTQLGKKSTELAKAKPFFIKIDHKFADGTEGPLFMFGKFPKVKKEIKELKGATELHGVAYVETDEKGVSTLCLAPSKGKLEGKVALLAKAMKVAFTNTYANFKIVAGVTEEQMAALEAAAEAETEDVEAPSAAEEVAKPVAEPAKPEASSAAADAKNIIADAFNLVKTGLAGVIANVKAQKAADTDLKLVSTILDKIKAAQGVYNSLPAVVQQALKAAYDATIAQLGTAEKVKSAIEKLLGGSAKPAGESKELTAEQLAAIEKMFGGAIDAVKSYATSFEKDSAKSAEALKSAPSAAAPSGQEMLKQMF